MIDLRQYPEEHRQAIDTVPHHQEIFARPPRLVAADRGVYSAETKERLRAAGFKQVAIPAAGKTSAERKALERTRSFRRGYRLQGGHRRAHCQTET